MTLLHYFPNGFERYLLGGLLIGLGVTFLYLTTGRLGGASTVFSSTWSWWVDRPFFQQASLVNTRVWRVIYALGMVLGGCIFVALGHAVPDMHISLWRLIVGGLLIGFGTRLGSGCTSGHGICGIAALSGGSLLMVIIFLSTAIITAMLMAALGVLI